MGYYKQLAESAWLRRVAMETSFLFLLFLLIQEAAESVPAPEQCIPEVPATLSTSLWYRTFFIAVILEFKGLEMLKMGREFSYELVY